MDHDHLNADSKGKYLLVHLPPEMLIGCSRRRKVIEGA